MKIVVLIVIAARAGVFRLRPECLSAIPQGPYTRRPRRTVSSGSIPVALSVGGRRSAGSWDRVAADQPLRSAGADNSWAGNRKYLLYHLLLNHEGVGRRIVVMNERLRIGHQPSKFS